MLDGWGYNDDCNFYDGDNDNYHIYEPNLGGVYYREYGTNKKSIPFVKNSSYYHGWVSFDRIIERDTCYSILRNDIWMNVPKKIIKEVKDTTIFVHLRTFGNIETSAIEKYLGV